jgi:hypothetical protein
MKITDEMIEAGWHAVHGVKFEEVRKILTAALSASPAGAVKPKPLEWRDEGTGVFRRVRATTSIGTYSTWRLDGSLDYSLYYNEELIKTCSDLEAAKTAAFADYSARIMSAIEPAGVGVETEAPSTHVGGDTIEYTLRAMAQNYAGGHSWDHLDGEACTKAADEIRMLRAGIKRMSDEEELCAETTGDDPFSLVYLAAKLAAAEARAEAAEALLKEAGPIIKEVAELPDAVTQRHLVQLLVCPEGDERTIGSSTNYGPIIRAARSIAAKIGGKDE